MRNKFTLTLLMIGTVILSLTIYSCGSNDAPYRPSSGDTTTTTTSTDTTTTASTLTIFGVASSDTATTSTISVKDSSVPVQEKTVATNSSGDYTIDASDLTPPFMLKAKGPDQTLYSLSKNGGQSNINAISDTAVAAAVNDASGSASYLMLSSASAESRRKNNDDFDNIIARLRTVLAPLFALYQITGNAVNDDNDHHDSDAKARRALFHDVKFVVTNHKVIVTNRATGGVIFSGPLSDLSSGTFYPENMPVGPGGSNSCAYTYSPWGVCLSSSTQIRSLLTSTPTGCTGTPILSQTCTYTPPVTACTSFTYSAWGTCQSDNTQTRAIQSSSPAGCTGGTPLLSQSCTYVPPINVCTSFTYSAWGTCQSDNTQSRTVSTSLPAGCTGGTPLLSQSCTYVPPTSSCGSCHSIPPTTGQHTFHVTSQKYSCSTCHGTGYSATTVNATTHNNGTIDVVSSLNFNATASTCAPACHGSRSW